MSGTRWTYSNYGTEHFFVLSDFGRQDELCTYYNKEVWSLKTKECVVPHIETKETQCGTRDRHSITSTPIKYLPTHT